MTSFQHTIRTAALTNVQSYLARYTQDQTEGYVQSALIYYGEIPFLHRVFDPTDVRSKKEKGGYKVVSVSHPPGLHNSHIFAGETWYLSTPNDH